MSRQHPPGLRLRSRDMVEVRLVLELVELLVLELVELLVLELSDVVRLVLELHKLPA